MKTIVKGTCLLLILVVWISCNKKLKHTSNTKISTEKIKSVSLKKTNFKNKSQYKLKTLETENVLINNHKVILSTKEFKNVYTTVDSTKTQLWECGNPLEWLDERWMTETYGNKSKESGTFEKYNGDITTIYEKQIEFITNDHIVLFDRAFAKNNSLTVISHKIKLDLNTTLEDFAREFPNAQQEKLTNPDEVRFRLYIAEDAEAAFLFYFKNGKLDYFTLWWLLC